MKINECLVNKIIKKENIEYILLNGFKAYSDEIIALIEDTWRAKTSLSDSRYLYDGNVCSLIDYKLSGDRLICTVQRSTYKAYIGTNVNNIDKIPDKSQLTNAIAACVVCMTTDDHVIVGCRSAKVAEDTEYWHVIGGTMEGIEAGHSWQPENPYDLIYREMNEEINIFYEDIIALDCIGFGRSLHNHKPEFLFRARLKLDSQALLHKAQNHSDKIDEHTEFRCIPIHEILSFVQNNKFSPIGILAIELLSQQPLNNY